MRPPVPIVFTSRTDPASFLAAAPEGEGFHYPGQRLWAAREGRLRLLTPAGQVIELTWQKPLPDGDTLIDVMSPSVTLDGRCICFLGVGKKMGMVDFACIRWDWMDAVCNLLLEGRPIPAAKRYRLYDGTPLVK
jgi:hypothetical protein